MPTAEVSTNKGIFWNAMRDVEKSSFGFRMPDDNGKCKEHVPSHCSKSVVMGSQVAYGIPSRLKISCG